MIIPQARNSTNQVKDAKVVAQAWDAVSQKVLCLWLHLLPVQWAGHDIWSCADHAKPKVREATHDEGEDDLLQCVQSAYILAFFKIEISVTYHDFDQ